MSSQRTGLAHRHVARLLTPPGVGGVAVIDVRGPDVITRLAVLFQPSRGALAERGSASPGSAIRGRLRHLGQTIDDGLLFLWPRDGRAELHLHGGRRIVQRAVLALASVGIDAEIMDSLDAYPGHTVIDRMLMRALAHAPTSRAAAWIAWQLDQGIGPAWRELTNAPHDASVIREHAAAWLVAGERARALVEPTPVLLMGPPNAGKSSLFNAWVGREAAIVSPIAGTTRDYVDAACEVAGVPIQLYDTAGLRDSGDELEQAGVARGRKLRELPGAWSLVLLDGSCPLPAEWSQLSTWPADRDRTIWVRTHADLPQADWQWPAGARQYANVSMLDDKSLGGLAEQLAEALLPAAALGPGPAAVDRDMAAWLRAEVQQLCMHE